MTNTYVQNFGSVSELIDTCNRSVANKGVHKEDDGGVTRAYFIGRRFSSWQDVAHAAVNYWQEGLDIVQQMIFEIDRETHDLPRPIDRKRRRQFSEQGGSDVDYDRLRAGQSDYWQETRRTYVTAPQHITLIASTGAAARVDSEKILWRGAAMICLADILEKAGYRVEIYICNYATGAYRNRDSLFNSINVKRAEEPLDIASIVNAASGWFFRSVIFQSYYTRDDTSPAGNMGYTISINPELDAVKDLIGQNTTAILIDDVWSLSAALDKVREVIKKLNEGGYNDLSP